MLIARPKTDEQIRSLKAFMKALDIEFEIPKTEDIPYNKEFIAKIEQGRQDYKDGKGTILTMDQLQQLCK